VKILLRQQGGLGNQLFQYAAGLYFAKQLGATLEIIRAPMEYQSCEGHPRVPLVSKFAISAPVRERNEWDRLMCAVVVRKRHLRRTFRTGMFRQPHEDKDHIPTQISVERKTKRLYIEGWWETHKIPQAVEDELRTQLVLIDPPCGRNAEILQQIRETPVPVSLHVRHGDLATVNGGKYAMPFTYQRNAMQAAVQSLPNAKFFVFSDDMAYARKHLPRSERTVFVDHNDQANAHEDLRLMSACHHHIVANSTLSWWGAWLNPRREKLVFVPDPWKASNRDIVPPDWQRISVGPS
jgi:hypothetical protein